MPARACGVQSRFHLCHSSLKSRCMSSRGIVILLLATTSSRNVLRLCDVHRFEQMARAGQHQSHGELGTRLGDVRRLSGIADLYPPEMEWRVTGNCSASESCEGPYSFLHSSGAMSLTPTEAVT